MKKWFLFTVFCLVSVPAVAQIPDIPTAPPGFDPAQPCADLLARIESTEFGILISQGRVTALSVDLAEADAAAIAAYDAWVAAKASGDTKLLTSATVALAAAYKAAADLFIALTAEKTLLTSLKAQLIELQREYANLGC